MIRAVLDVNILISALIRPEGPPGKILRLFLEHRSFELILSPSILHEFHAVLFYPKVRKYLSLKDDEAEKIVFSIGSLVAMVADGPAIDVVKTDPDDNKYLTAALEGQVHYLVSGDRHLLDLHRFQSIRIVKARDFLKTIL